MGLKILTVANIILIAFAVYLIYAEGITFLSICFLVSNLLMLCYILIFVKPKRNV